MSTKTLRINGFGVNAAGSIECVRELDADIVVNGIHMSGSRRGRYAHEHCAVIRFDVGDSKAAKEFAAKLVAAIDEPAALVGAGRSGTVLLFHVGASYDVEHAHQAQHPFVFDGKQCGFLAAAAGQTLDVAAYQWKDSRSPLTVACAALPPLYSDISTRAYEALDGLLAEHGGRWGSVTEQEPVEVRVLREFRERKAAGLVDAPVDEDARLVARHPMLRPTDGVLGQFVAAARQRLARRRESA